MLILASGQTRARCYAWPGGGRGEGGGAFPHWEKTFSNLFGEIFGEVRRLTRPGEQIANSPPASFALASASSMQPSPASRQLVRIAFATR